MVVEVAQSEELDGLGSIVADLLADNLASEPGRERLVRGRKWAVAIAVPEAESSFRINLGGETITVVADTADQPTLRLTTDGDTLIEIPEVQLVAGLPSPFTASGRLLISKLLRRQVVIEGIVRHPILLTRILRLLNTADLT